MRKNISALCGLVLLLAYCTAMASVFSVLSIVEEMENIDPGLWLWLPCLALCYTGLSLFLKKERSVRSVVFFCGCFFSLQAVLVFAVYGFFSSFVGVLAAISMWLFSYLCCYEFSIKSPSPEKLTKGFDLCGILLVFLLFFCSVKDCSFLLALPLLLCSVALLLVLVLARGGEGRRGRSMFISVLALTVFAALSLAVVLLASGGIKRLMLFLKDTAFALMRFVFRLIGLAFEFLISLFPEKEYDILPPELESSISAGASGDMSFGLIDPQLLLALIIGFGLAIAAVLLIVSIVRSKKVGAMARVGGEQSLRRSRTGLGKAIMMALHRLSIALRFRYLCIARRNTAPGLFVQLERRSRSKLRGRAEGESCREFICRAVSLYPHAEAELMRLADAMDSLCFGSGDMLTQTDIKKMSHTIFAKNKNTEI